MTINYQRFPNFAAMTAWVQAHVMVHEGPWQVESPIYQEGVCFRPSVLLFSDNETISLRWYAYAEEDGIDFMGPNARQKACAKGSEYCERLIEAVDALL